MSKKVIWTPSEDIFVYGKRIAMANHRYNATLIKTHDLMAAISYRGVLVRVPKSTVLTQPRKPSAPHKITPADLKKFGDICFEVGIRYRDRWRSVISGKKFAEGDWDGLQAGHGLSRGHWDTRHNGMNCHAITKFENLMMTFPNSEITKKYWEYVARTFGKTACEELRNHKAKTIHLDLAYLREDCERCYNFLRLQTQGYKRTPDEIIRWRCESLPERERKGVLSVLETME